MRIEPLPHDIRSIVDGLVGGHGADNPGTFSVLIREPAA
jgi:hypothetical protein